MLILYRQKYRQKSLLTEKHYTCFCCFLAWRGHPDITHPGGMMAQDGKIKNAPPPPPVNPVNPVNPLRGCSTTTW